MQRLSVLGLMIFVGACSRNIPSQIDTCNHIMCTPIYGRASDWGGISDDLARNIYRHNKLCEEYNKS